MAFASKRQNLDLFYNMFKTEYETSIRNVEMCKETVSYGGFVLARLGA